MAKKFDLAGLIAGQGASGAVSDSDTIVRLPVEELHDNSGNFYSVEDVQELCDSIAVSGVLQPVLVRPRAEGGYLLISGHRRTKAVRLLREEWKGNGANPFDTIPAIVRPAPSSKAEELLEELALIATNSATRKLSDPELSKQAERMSDLLYGLKKEGYKFPGRMRKTVAEAVGVSETKLARLKKIREGLSVGWMARWEAGTVPEYTAEALAKLEPDVQEALLFREKLEPAAVESLAKYYGECFRGRECLCGRGSCDMGGIHWLKGRRTDQSWNRCGGYYYSSAGPCCEKCSKIDSCKEACPKAKAKRVEKQAQRKQEEEERQARREAENAEKQRTADLLWARFKAAREKWPELSSGDVEAVLDEAELWDWDEGDLQAFEDRDKKKLPFYAVSCAPEAVLSFKGVWLAAKILEVPVEALTDMKWKPEESPSQAAAEDGGTDCRDSDVGHCLAMTDARGPGDAGDGGPSSGAPRHSAREGPTLGRVRDSHLPPGEGRPAGDGDPSSVSPSGCHLPPGEGKGDSDLWWRPFPRIKPEEGQRALVVQESQLTSYLFEAKLARWEGGAWYWVSEQEDFASIEVERVTLWLPEPETREFEEEEDDAEEEAEGGQ